MIIFTVIGVWIISLLVLLALTFMVALLLDKDNWDDASIWCASLCIVLALITLGCSTVYTNFKSNPEKYGYTQIIEEVVEVEE